jgi:hypothetical protein
MHLCEMQAKRRAPKKKFPLEKNSWNTYNASRWRESFFYIPHSRGHLFARVTALCRAEWNASWRRTLLTSILSGSRRYRQLGNNGKRRRRRISKAACANPFPACFQPRSRAQRRWLYAKRRIASLLFFFVSVSLPPLAWAFSSVLVGTFLECTRAYNSSFVSLLAKRRTNASSISPLVTDLRKYEPADGRHGHGRCDFVEYSCAIPRSFNGRRITTRNLAVTDETVLRPITTMSRLYF